MGILGIKICALSGAPKEDMLALQYRQRTIHAQEERICEYFVPCKAIPELNASNCRLGKSCIIIEALQNVNTRRISARKA